MDLVRDPKVNWLSLKWYFITASVLLVAAGALSLSTAQVPFSVDFTGGTLVHLKFSQEPELERIRRALSGQEFRDAGVTRFDDPELNQVQIRMGVAPDPEGEVDLADETQRIYQALKAEFDPETGGKADLNRASRADLIEYIEGLGPDVLAAPGEGRGEEATNGGESPAGPVELAQRIVDLRTNNSGLITDFPQLEQAALPQGLAERLRQDFYLGSFTIISSESVGPKVGSEMKERAYNAVIFSLGGMLIYIWFRFKFVYGVAAIVALFHDVFITVGFFSIFGKEISLTVIAALLTLVGYSLNDTIVIFDRVRENVNLMRRRSLTSIINTSINQTLNRTILTSATFFMAALALYMLGGEALNGFSFALVMGVLVGTYSSVAIASPIVIWWDEMAQRRKAPGAR